MFRSEVPGDLHLLKEGGMCTFRDTLLGVFVREALPGARII
jgi:hypothetical protein